jgi:voltage-gated potassium channel
VRGRQRREARRNRVELRIYERLTLVRAVNLIVLVTLLLTLGAAVLERLAEPETFTSFGDACWWAIATVSSTGFGDVVPQTAAGKAVATVVMVTSMAWIPAITTIVVTLHMSRERERHAFPASDRAHEEVLERLRGLERLVARSRPDALPAQVGGDGTPLEPAA